MKLIIFDVLLKPAVILENNSVSIKHVLDVFTVNMNVQKNCTDISR